MINTILKLFRKAEVAPAPILSVMTESQAPAIPSGSRYRLMRNNDINPFEEPEVIVTVLETRTNQYGTTWVKYVMGKNMTLESTKTLRDFLAIYEPC